MADPLFLELEFRHRDGFPVVTTCTVFATGSAGDFRAGGFLHDAGVGSAAASALARERLHDPLTGLASRRAGGHESDITDAVVRRHALALGLVDGKVAAIDDDSSVLWFAWRLAGHT